MRSNQILINGNGGEIGNSYSHLVFLEFAFAFFSSVRVRTLLLQPTRLYQILVGICHQPSTATVVTFFLLLRVALEARERRRDKSNHANNKIIIYSVYVVVSKLAYYVKIKTCWRWLIFTVWSQSTSCCSLRLRSFPVAIKLAPSIAPVVLNAQHAPHTPWRLIIDHPTLILLLAY